MKVNLPTDLIDDLKKIGFKKLDKFDKMTWDGGILIFENKDIVMIYDQDGNSDYIQIFNNHIDDDSIFDKSIHITMPKIDDIKNLINKDFDEIVKIIKNKKVPYAESWNNFTKKGNKMKIDRSKLIQFSKLMATNFGDDDNYGDTQNVDGIDREAVFEAGMSTAHEIFGDETDEAIVRDMVDKAIDEALRQNGDTQVAIGILKNMFTKKDFAEEPEKKDEDVSDNKSDVMKDKKVQQAIDMAITYLKEKDYDNLMDFLTGLKG